MSPCPPETRTSLIMRLPNAAYVSAWEDGEEAARALAELPIPESQENSEFDLEYRREVFR